MVLPGSQQNKKGEIKVAYCTTTKLLGDFLIKPQQGRIFRKMWSTILNLPNTQEIDTKHRSVLGIKKCNANTNTSK